MPWAAELHGLSPVILVSAAYRTGSRIRMAMRAGIDQPRQRVMVIENGRHIQIP